MPIRFDKLNGRWRFEFDRVIPGQGRNRTSRLLPKGWSRGQADTYDRTESARLYAVASGISADSEKLIDDAVEVYLADHAHLKNYGGLVAELARCFSAYTGRPMSQLADVAREYVKDNAASEKPLQPATIKNRLSYLRAACRYAWKKYDYCQHDPGAKMVMPVVNNERHVYLNRAQMLRIARKIPNLAARAALRIGFYSGMREAEICRAVVVNGEFVLADTKNGSRRNIPVHYRVAHIVRNPSLWPMPISKWTISHHFTWANRIAGVPGAVFHTARHSTASELINAGWDLKVVGDVLGHKSGASTRRYAHISTETIGRALQSVGRKTPHSPAIKQA